MTTDYKNNKVMLEEKHKLILKSVISSPTLTFLKTGITLFMVFP